MSEHPAKRRPSFQFTLRALLWVTLWACAWMAAAKFESNPPGLAGLLILGMVASTICVLPVARDRHSDCR